MTTNARPLLAAGLAVLALSAAGVVVLSSHGATKATVDLHIVGATATTVAPPVTGAPTSETATAPAPAATVPTTLVAPTRVAQRATKPLVTRAHIVTTSTTATTHPALPPGVKLIPPIQCRPGLGCGTPR